MPPNFDTFRLYTHWQGASTVDRITCVCIYLFSGNPLYLGVILVVFLLLKALWVQLDISREFRNGAIPGFLSLSTKFLPTVMNLLRRLAEEGQRQVNGEPQRNPAPASKSFSSSPNDHSAVSSCASPNVNSSENGAEYSRPFMHDKTK